MGLVLRFVRPVTPTSRPDCISTEFTPISIDFFFLDILSLYSHSMSYESLVKLMRCPSTLAWTYDLVDIEPQAKHKDASAVDRQYQCCAIQELARSRVITCKLPVEETR